MNQARIIADEAIIFMMNKSNMTREQIVKAIDDGHEATCKYFSELCAIGMMEYLKQNQ